MMQTESARWSKRSNQLQFTRQSVNGPVSARVSFQFYLQKNHSALAHLINVVRLFKSGMGMFKTNSLLRLLNSRVRRLRLWVEGSDSCRRLWSWSRKIVKTLEVNGLSCGGQIAGALKSRADAFLSSRKTCNFAYSCQFFILDSLLISVWFFCCERQKCFFGIVRGNHGKLFVIKHFQKKNLLRSLKMAI